MMRVLLFSPLAGRDPAGGDVTYTELLLQNPPPDVAYTTYAEALAAGDVVVRGRRPRHGNASLKDLAALALRVGHKALADRLVYREPPWFVTVDTSKFDLIHQHLFSVRQIGPQLPSVSSCGMPLAALYQSREGWTGRKTDLADAVLAYGARRLAMHVPGVWPGPCGVLTGFTPQFCAHIEARLVRCPWRDLGLVHDDNDMTILTMIVMIR